MAVSRLFQQQPDPRVYNMDFIRLSHLHPHKRTCLKLYQNKCQMSLNCYCQHQQQQKRHQQVCMYVCMHNKDVCTTKTHIQVLGEGRCASVIGCVQQRVIQVQHKWQSPTFKESPHCSFVVGFCFLLTDMQLLPTGYIEWTMSGTLVFLTAASTYPCIARRFSSSTK
jgi:hypothetical protein